MLDELIKRVFCIRFEGSYGTAFRLFISGHEYLITAGHVVDGIEEKDVIKILVNDKWEICHTNLIGIENLLGNDIAVLVIDKKIPNPNSQVILDAEESYSLGDQVLFAGFPFYHPLEQGVSMPNGFPIPFIRNAYISGTDSDVIYLDGMSNQGFSGSPIVSEQNGKPKVIGVLSGALQEKKSNDVYENAGITVCTPICRVLEIINNS